MRSQASLFVMALAGGTSVMGCTLLAGITEDYRLVTSSTSSGGTGGTTSSASSSSSGATGGGGATSSSSSGATGGGGATSSSSSSGATGGGGATSSSSSSGTGGTGGTSSSSTSSGTLCQPNSKVSCYTGLAGTMGVGVCQAGEKTCDGDGSGYGPCQGEVTPGPENCSTPVDDDCDGTALDDDAGCVCLPGSSASCYSGPGGTEGIGICLAGATVCNTNGKGYGFCAGEVLPGIEDCNTPEDEDCDGVAPPCLGGEVWAKRFGDATSQVAKGVAVLGDGTSYWTGYMNGTVDFGAGPLASPGGTDVFLAKLDPGGAMVWAKRFGDGGNQEGRAVAVDSSGNVAITGAFAGVVNLGGGALTSAGSYDVFLAELDASGGHLWSKNFGNNSNQYGDDVAFLPSGEVVIAGHFGGTLDFGGGTLTSAGSTDVFIAKFGADGAHKWSHIAGNSVAQLATSVAVQPASSEIIMTGYFQGQIDFGATSTLTTQGSNDIFLVGFDAAGNDLWSKRFGDGGDQQAQAVAVDANGNIALTGQFGGTVDFGCGTLTSAGGYDVFVAVFSSTGSTTTCTWSKRFGDTTDQTAYGVTFDAAGNVVVTGAFNGSVNFSGAVLTSTGGLDVFVAKFDQVGTPLWSKKAGDLVDQSSSCVGVDASKNIFAGGSFAGAVNFGTTNLTSAGTEDIFFTKLSP